MEYDVSKIKVENLTKKEGVFKPEDGSSEFKYSTYQLKFTIGDYPLIFTAKVDKVLKDYIDEAYNA